MLLGVIIKGPTSSLYHTPTHVSVDVYVTRFLTGRRRRESEWRRVRRTYNES